MGYRVDAAVLGAGLAGSSLAKDLADRGWDTVLLDRQTFPRHKVCGEFLSPEAQSTLEAFGLMESLKTLRPSLIERLRFVFENGAEIEMPLPGTAWGLSRYSLDTALHHAAVEAGARIRTGAVVTAVQPSGKGYKVWTRQNGEDRLIEARTVIAAWGGNPRSGLPGYRPGRSAKQSYMGVKSHFHGIEMEPVVEMYFFRGGYLGICPIEGGLVNAAALLERESFTNTGKSIQAFIEEAARRNPRLKKRLAHAEMVAGTQTAVAPVLLNRRPVPWDKMPILGDAAAMIPPLCGDGMSMALRSAALCAPLTDRYLRGNLSMEEWRDTFTRSIQKEFNRPLRWGSLLQWLLGMPQLSRLLPGAARLAPGIAQELVRATRLKPYRA
ncbi:NAD(P)/FAD-dependent oxidoreductase [Paenibacillus sp. sgz302251]|uniref:NAD(P)/FAD-dependent oxidoreductase n=1 Tax=Paenibacillus sp. sgz302251 TaxID=3414493 RepID=UPI003C7B20BE